MEREIQSRDFVLSTENIIPIKSNFPGILSIVKDIIVYISILPLCSNEEIHEREHYTKYLNV